MSATDPETAAAGVGKEAIGAGPCSFCGATSATWFTWRPKPWGVVVCAGCGLGRTVPMPSPEQSQALYAGDYADESARKFGGGLELGRRFFARRLADRIERRAISRGRVLDIGCGDGKLLLDLAGRGFTCVGTELNPRVPETVPKESGVEVHVGDLESGRFADASFQVVIIRHVLEHLRDPAATLREIRRVLDDRGVLLLAMPNLDSWQGRLLRDHWFHLDLPRHLHHFTPRTLEAMLSSCGFAMERPSHFSLEQNPYGWLQSSFTAAGGRWRHLYDQLRASGSTHAQPRDLVVSAAAAAAVPLCVVLATVESVFGHGGTFEVWARPR